MIYYVNEILIIYSMALDTVFSFNQQGILLSRSSIPNFTFGFYSSKKFEKTKTIITSQLDYTFICLKYIIFHKKYTLLMCYKITV